MKHRGLLALVLSASLAIALPFLAWGPARAHGPIAFMAAGRLPVVTLSGQSTCSYTLRNVGGGNAATVTPNGSSDGGANYDTISSAGFGAQTTNGVYGGALIPASGEPITTNFYVAVSGVTGTVYVSEYCSAQVAQRSGGGSSPTYPIPVPSGGTGTSAPNPTVTAAACGASPSFTLTWPSQLLGIPICAPPAGAAGSVPYYTAAPTAVLSPYFATVSQLGVTNGLTFSTAAGGAQNASWISVPASADCSGNFGTWGNNRSTTIETIIAQIFESGCAGSPSLAIDRFGDIGSLGGIVIENGLSLANSGCSGAGCGITWGFPGCQMFGQGGSTNVYLGPSGSNSCSLAIKSLKASTRVCASPDPNNSGYTLLVSCSTSWEATAAAEASAQHVWPMTGPIGTSAGQCQHDIVGTTPLATPTPSGATPMCGAPSIRKDLDTSAYFGGQYISSTYEQAYFNVPQAAFPVSPNAFSIEIIASTSGGSIISNSTSEMLFDMDTSGHWEAAVFNSGCQNNQPMFCIRMYNPGGNVETANVVSADTTLVYSANTAPGYSAGIGGLGGISSLAGWQGRIGGFAIYSAALTQTAACAHAAAAGT